MKKNNSIRKKRKKSISGIHLRKNKQISPQLLDTYHNINHLLDKIKNEIYNQGNNE